MTQHDEDEARPSKSARKREAHALQSLGERLIRLRDAELATLDLPEPLVDAILEARRIKSRAAGARQRQYIGRLMRDIDPAPLQAAFERWEQGPAEERARFAELERWRTRLLDDPAALDAFMAEHPHSDRAALARQIADAREERAHGGPPHHQRALFRTLKALSK